MDNASKNAKDMIGSLQMKCNRGRRAVITNEPVDIITGKFDFLFRRLSIPLPTWMTSKQSYRHKPTSLTWSMEENFLRNSVRLP